MPVANRKQAAKSKTLLKAKPEMTKRKSASFRPAPSREHEKLPSPVTARVSSKGQVVIPAMLRRKYRLEEGVTVLFREEAGHIVLEPDRFAAFYALRGSIPFDLEGMLIEEKRREREREDRER